MASGRRLLGLLLSAGLLTGMTATASAAPSLPACQVGDVLTQHASLDEWASTVLDTTYRLPRNYRPTDLVSTARAGLNGGNQVRRLVIPDLRAMTNAARRAGVRFDVASAYRSFATQGATFRYWAQVRGMTFALRNVARAGHSENQLGTALDFRSLRGAAPWNVRDWANTRAGAWLKANAWKFGFVMSYPQGMRTVTCTSYQPWHYRYVGRAMAVAMHDSGLTLRETLLGGAPTGTPPPPAEPTPTPLETPEPRG